MPIYDYACSTCGRVTEVIHGIHDPGPRFCPECGAEGTMRKALSTPAIVFKGSGWAKLDRRSSSGSKASASGSKAGSGSAEGSTGGATGGATGGSTERAGASANSATPSSTPPEKARGGEASTSEGGRD